MQRTGAQWSRQCCCKDLFSSWVWTHFSSGLLLLHISGSRTPDLVNFQALVLSHSCQYLPGTTPPILRILCLREIRRLLLKHKNILGKINLGQRLFFHTGRLIFIDGWIIYLFTYLFEMASYCVAHASLDSTHHIALAGLELLTLNLSSFYLSQIFRL